MPPFVLLYSRYILRLVFSAYAKEFNSQGTQFFAEFSDFSQNSIKKLNSICRCFRELKISTHILAVKKESVSSLNKLDWDMQSFTEFKTKSETKNKNSKNSVHIFKKLNLSA